VSAAAAVVHYYWLVKSDIRLPVFYGALVGMLLLWRAINRRKAPPVNPSRQRPGTTQAAPAGSRG